MLGQSRLGGPRFASQVTIALAIASLGVAACGGAAPEPVTPAAASSTPASASATEASASAATPATASASGGPSSATPTAKKIDDDVHDDPGEVQGTITMAPLLSKSTPRSTYPKSSVTDHQCWEGIALSGQHRKDYDEIVSKCGAPTGLAEYARPVTGALHHKHDKRDTYELKLAGGFCYRYFGVADAGISDLDILVEKPNGALVADDKTSQPVAIIESDKPWCMDSDETYKFQIEIDGAGKGGYTFGVWARPKK